jgi:hypothetical protein
MATWHGPLHPILIYDMAPEADHVIRTDAADTIEAGGVIAPARGRIDSRTRSHVCPRQMPRRGRRP